MSFQIPRWPRGQVEARTGYPRAPLHRRPDARDPDTPTTFQLVEGLKIAIPWQLCRNGEWRQYGDLPGLIQ